MYKKNFLDKVIVRVDFTKEISEIDKALPEPIVEAVMKYFPIPEPKVTHGQEYQIGPQQMAVKEVTHQEWHYYGKDREKDLSITRNSMSITYNVYNDSFENLKKTFIDAINILHNTYNDLLFRRLGIRYIDKIEFNETDYTSWDKYIDKKLLSIFDIEPDKTKLSRAFNILESNYGNMNVRFQYGMYNPDYPAPIKKKIFILDSDVFLEAVQTNQEIESNLARFHDKLGQLFESSITDELRKVMNG